ncbi:DNA repair protein [Intoshia linei]|uniref:DNA repair protein n=1 Tax=Intoshia linei TaxID=1819745 RepID=A0A177B6Z3_9BILA|nr:DNA repair protein [Intoshia linei]
MKNVVNIDDDSGSGFFHEKKKENCEIIREIVKCMECHKNFHLPQFYHAFGIEICFSCSSKIDKYKCITRTDCKKKYLLKDSDLDNNEPLNFMLKNTFRQIRNKKVKISIKLYLKSQVVEKSLKIWGSLDKIEEIKLINRDKLSARNTKKFEKEIKNMRFKTNQIPFKISEPHHHNFEILNDKNATGTKRCIICEKIVEYEIL